MDRAHFIDLAKNFGHTQQTDCSELIEDFDEKYNNIAQNIEEGDMFYDFREYINSKYIPDDFPEDYDDLDDKQQRELDLMFAKSYTDLALEDGGTTLIAICAILHDYFEDCLDMI